MNAHRTRRIFAIAAASLYALLNTNVPAQETVPLPKAFIDGSGPGWHALTEEYFTHVNCDTNTWTWTNGFVQCTGHPIGVIRSTVLVTNFELVAQWRFLQSAGNSGIFVWATPESIAALEKGNPRL